MAKDGQNYGVDSSLLQATGKEVVTRLNDYITDVSELFVKLAVRSDVGTDIKNMTAGGYFNLEGELISNPPSPTTSSYQYIDIDRTKCYYLQVNLIGQIISQLNLFDEKDNLIKSIHKSVKGYYVFDGVSGIGISGVDDVNLIVKE